MNWIKRSYHVISDNVAYLVLPLIVILLTGSWGIARAQAPKTPVPLVTLVPPTVVATLPPPTAIPPLINSALVRIKSRVTDEGFGKTPTLVVGIAYNIPRFAQIDDTGEVQGYEADIARAIAEDMGVKLVFKQVTRQNAYDMLISEQIDLLMGQVLLSRDQQTNIDYSDPIFANKQVALVLNSAKAQDVKDLAGATVGIVTGSRADQAFTQWSAANNIQATVTHYPMLDNAVNALLNNQITALIGDRWELDAEVGNGKVQGIKLLTGAIRIDPYAIAMQRYDDNMRTIVNRTLQRLRDGKRLDPLYDKWFSATDLPTADRVEPYVWVKLSDDTRSIDNFPSNIIRPQQSVVDRIKACQPLRVAGLGAPVDASGKPPILESLNQALITEMAKRWNVQMQAIPNSYGQGEDMLAGGQADIAVGLEPHWGTTDRIDYAGIYATHDYRLLVRYGSSNITVFANFFATQHRMGVFADDPAAWDEVVKLAKAYSISPDGLHKIVVNSDQDAANALTTDTPIADALFGDSLHILPLISAFPKYVQLAGNDPKQVYPPSRQVAFGVPRDDADFRVLVETTLQDMSRDGTYQNIWQNNFAVVGAPLNILVWPGSSAGVTGIKCGSQ